MRFIGKIIYEHIILLLRSVVDPVCVDEVAFLESLIGRSVKDPGRVAFIDNEVNAEGFDRNKIKKFLQEIVHVLILSEGHLKIKSCEGLCVVFQVEVECKVPRLRIEGLH